MKVSTDTFVISKVNGEELANHIYNSQKMVASAQKDTMNANASLEKLEMVEKRLNDMKSSSYTLKSCTM